MVAQRCEQVRHEFHEFSRISFFAAPFVKIREIRVKLLSHIRVHPCASVVNFSDFHLELLTLFQGCRKTRQQLGYFFEIFKTDELHW